ncbi:helix-turn-helix domain-containing protein [Rhodovulum visakhapatnamense]|uniref:Regulatory helix-turn-helix LysR family protein n=1 Tax=Rhodovulum visakhapatnamense TaxID=364297 RepID=A0A4R8G0F8_9RHOB|nr:LysR family transcriptional regulator [Rhodovulum visakhapatnamense]TDX32556.1 regulatory helix-turn-helix LysR family protein [Rhodovulum visakhapatnamense]
MDRLNRDDVRLFLALAREGTLSGAARQLGLGGVAMSRRIERMEQVMEVPPFLRHRQGLDLTDRGAALRRPQSWARASGGDGRLMLGTLEAQVAAVRDGTGTGVLPHFLARRPGLRVLAPPLPDGTKMERPLLPVSHADLAASGPSPTRSRRASPGHRQGITRARADLAGKA